MTTFCGDCKHYNGIEFESDANKGLGLCRRKQSGYAVSEDDPCCQEFEVMRC